MASKKKAKSVFAAPLREFALGLPGAYEDHPWGESVAKVAKKVFVFFGHDEVTDFGMSVKLPQSKLEALSLPWTEPTGYGLGKSGWVSVKLAEASGIHQCGATSTVWPSTLSAPASKSYWRGMTKFCDETAKPARASSPAIQSKACAAPGEPKRCGPKLS